MIITCNAKEWTCEPGVTVAEAFAALLRERPGLSRDGMGWFPAFMAGLVERVFGGDTACRYLVICESFRHMEYCARAILGGAGIESIPGVYLGYDSLTCLQEDHIAYSATLGGEGVLSLVPYSIGHLREKGRRQKCQKNITGSAGKRGKPLRNAKERSSSTCWGTAAK